MIKAVLFDGYGTLFSGGMDRLYEVCQTISDDHGLGMDGKTFLDVWDAYFFPLVRGDAFVTFRDAHMAGLVEAFKEMGVAAEPKPYVDRVFDLLGQVTLYDDVIPTLRGLDGFAHGVVSNADSDHLHNALSSNGLAFDLVVSSESAEAYKPNPEIFSYALEALNCNPGDVLYVGDSQEDDLVATHRGGIRMAWINREGEALKEGIPKPDYEITSLLEIAGILEADGVAAKREK